MVHSSILMQCGKKEKTSERKQDSIKREIRMMSSDKYAGEASQAQLLASEESRKKKVW